MLALIVARLMVREAANVTAVGVTLITGDATLLVGLIDAVTLSDQVLFLDLATGKTAAATKGDRGQQEQLRRTPPGPTRRSMWAPIHVIGGHHGFNVNPADFLSVDGPTTM